MFETELPILSGSGQSAGAFTLEQRLQELRQELAALDETAALKRFAVEDYERVLKTTISLCPDCLRHVPAVVFTLGGRAWIRKSCQEHGLSDAVLENDEKFYFLSNKDCWGRRYADDRVIDFPAFEGACCGASGCCDSSSQGGGEGLDFTDQLDNKSCTVLVEVTNACNLSCKVCYSDSRGDRVLPLELFQGYLLKLIEQKGGLDSVQITGGEAILHPQFWEMVAFLHAQDGVQKIYLPTNGILFAQRKNAERLVPFRDKLMVLLQFDGQAADVNLNLRNANPAKIRQQVIEHLAELGVIMQLTMTLTRGVNDEEVGWVIDTAMRYSHIKVVAMQPVTYSGRYDLGREAVDRLTLSDLVKAVVRQAKVRVRDDDFIPIPCSHPNCGWLTLFVRRFGLKFNLARHIDLASVMDQVAYKTILSKREIQDMVGSPRPGLLKRLARAIGRRLIRPTDMIGIAIKPFMDCYNYDQDRISNCCHHLMDTNGQPISFCEYNALLRPSDSWEKFPVLSDS